MRMHGRSFDCARAIYFLTIRTTLIQPTQRRPDKRFGPRLNLKNFILIRQYFAQPSLKFYRGQKLRNFGTIFDPSRLLGALFSKRSNLSEI